MKTTNFNLDLFDQTFTRSDLKNIKAGVDDIGLGGTCKYTCLYTMAACGERNNYKVDAENCCC